METVKIVSIVHYNPLHQYIQAKCYDRVAQLANALTRLGMQQGDVVGTLVWNEGLLFSLSIGLKQNAAPRHLRVVGELHF